MQARRLWFLHKTGVRTLGGVELRSVFGILRHHHSRDFSFLQRIATEMAQSEVDWRCRACWRTNKANTGKCARCGILWSHGQDVTYVPQKQTRSPRRATWNYAGQQSQQTWATWADSQWADAQHGAKSQWTKSRGNTPKKRTSSRKKGKPVNYGAPEVEPPWQPNYSGGPTTSTTGEDSSGAQEKLAILATALQESNTTLAPNVRDIVNEHTTPAPSTKGLKAAVDKMDKARKKLKEAEKARYNMHAAWRRYIADSLQRWTQFAEKFGKDDQELAERVRAAKEKLQATKEEVDTKKAALEEADEEAHIDISDDDMQEKVDSAENIQASLTNMVANLHDLQQKAEAAIVEAGETKTKRQRTEEPGHGSSAAPPSSKNSSLEPFGGPGK